MKLFDKFNNLTITRRLRLATGATITLNSGTSSEVELSLAEQAVIDGVTAGTATASKALVLNESKGISTITSATITTLTTTNVRQTRASTAINSTATATAAAVAAGWITSTSAAATTITLPTGTLLGTALGATQGTIHNLVIDNTAGANTVTIAVAVNGILSAGAAAVAASFGLLTVPSGVTGQAQFTLMFSSATAYTFTRTA